MPAAQALNGFNVRFFQPQSPEHTAATTSSSEKNKPITYSPEPGKYESTEAFRHHSDFTQFKREVIETFDELCGHIVDDTEKAALQAFFLNFQEKLLLTPDVVL